jgi:hypothetical protein
VKRRNEIIRIALCAVALALTFGCGRAPRQAATETAPPQAASSPTAHNAALLRRANAARVIHVVVALCDNEYQGIVPVPAKIGNGDDAAHNLYWGAAYGVKTFFSKLKDWARLPDAAPPKPAVLERIVFKHKSRDVYLIADAYRGREIKQGTIDFLSFASGQSRATVETRTGIVPVVINAGGGADLIAYVGHDGLMDFALSDHPQKADAGERDAVILACISKRYFAEPLRATGARPLLWTTGRMAPEAYVLKAAIDGWMSKESGEQVRRRAAAAYDSYQKCGARAALKLFASGW